MTDSNNKEVSGIASQELTETVEEQELTRASETPETQVSIEIWETTETSETADLSDVPPLQTELSQVVAHLDKAEPEASQIAVQMVSENLPGDGQEKILRQEVVEPEITLEDLINWGFAAKNAGRYQSAAEWFSRALSLRPAPDLAFYLIMDACTLWLAVNKRAYAQELLTYYWQEYAHRFAPEQRTQMTAWLSKENLLS
ncbi:hypothetical protein JCM15765_44270 [Paradesulfitobacterium aromaticivorans]